MAFCEARGQKLSNNARLCPACGKSVEKSLVSDTENTNLSDDQTLSIIEKQNALLQVFLTDEERSGHDLIRLNGLFENSIGVLRHQLDDSQGADVAVEDFSGAVGMLAGLIKGVKEAASAYQLVADLDSIPANIKQLLKEGIYHIADSKKIGGNMRAAIVDADNEIKAQITLKNVPNTSSNLANISTLAMQQQLQLIQEQLHVIGSDVKYLVQFERREAFQTPFFNARSLILKATASKDEREIQDAVRDAERFLMQGINSLYGDLSDNTQKLAQLHKNWFSKLEDIDPVVGYIEEDLNLLPKYIGLRTYLLVLFGKKQEARSVLEEYQFTLKRMTSEQVVGGRLTAVQYIQKYYPYTEHSRDSWLTCLDDIGVRIEVAKETVYLEEKPTYQIEVVEVTNHGE